jgi:hypothetical protein
MASGFVYLLQELDFNENPTGLYKIGKTTQENTEKRRAQYKAGNARALAIFAEIPVRDAQAVETTLHRHFHAQRLVGFGGGDEWFRFDAPGLVVNEMRRYQIATASSAAQLAWQALKGKDSAQAKQQFDRVTQQYHDHDSSEFPWGLTLIAIGIMAVGIMLSSQTSSQTVDNRPTTIVKQSSPRRPQPTVTPWTIAPLYDKPNGTPTGRGIPRGQLTTIALRKQVGDRTWCKTPDVGWFRCD